MLKSGDASSWVRAVNEQADRLLQPRLTALPAALAILAVAAFLILNIPLLNMHPDEELSYRATQGGLMDTLRWQIDLEDNQAPGWFLIFRVWRTFIGDAEYTSRMLGIVLTLPALALIYRTARRAFGGQAAVFALLVLVGSGLFFQYALDIRMYPLVMLISTVSTYLLWRWLMTGRTAYALAYGAGVAAMLYTHYLLIFLLIVHALYFLNALTLSFEGRSQTRLGLFIQGIGAGVIAVLLFAPWLPIAVSQVSFLREVESQSGTARGGIGIGVSTLPTTPENVRALLDFATNNLPLVYLAIITLGILGVGTWMPGASPNSSGITPLALSVNRVRDARRSHVQRQTMLLAILWAVAVPAVCLLINTRAGVYAPRYVSYLTLGLALAVGSVLALLPIPRLLRVAALGGLIAANLINFPASIPDRIPYRQYLGELSAASQPGDVVLLVHAGEDDGFARWQYDHYLPADLAASITTDMNAARVSRRIWLVTTDWFDDDVRAVFHELEPDYPVQQVIGRCDSDRWWCFIAQLMEAPPLKTPIRFGASLDFRGADITRDNVFLQRGLEVDTHLWWTADSLVGRDLSFSLQLLTQDGALIANTDGAVNHYASETVQTSAMQPGRIYIDYRSVRFPEDTPAGMYELRLVVYDPVSGERLLTSDGADGLRLAMLGLD